MVGLESEHERRNADDDRGDERHLDGHEGVRRDEDADERQHGGEDRLDEEERGASLQVVDGAAALGHDLGHVGEVVVGEHDLGNVARGCRARGHGDGAVGLAQREDVVHAVARHGNGAAPAMQRVHELALLLRGHAAEDAGLVHRGVELLGGIEGRGVHVAVGVRDARELGDGAHRTGVVARNDAQLNALLDEVAHGLGSGVAELVADTDAGEQAHLADQLLARPEAPALADHEAALDVVEGLAERLRRLQRAVAEDELAGAHHKRASVPGHAAGVLARGAEGHDPREARLRRDAEQCRMGRERLRGLVRIGPVGRRDGGEGPDGVLLADARRGSDVRDLHLAGGDGARLIEAEGVHAGEGLDAVGLLDENTLGSEAGGRDGEDRGSEQHEALRNHAEDGRRRGEHRLAHRRPLHEHRAREEGEAQGHEQGRAESDNGAKGREDLGLDLFDILGLGVYLRRIAVATHLGHARHEAAALHEAAGVEGAAGTLRNGDGLAREKGLVAVHVTLDDLAVRRDLVAVGEAHEVVDDELGGRDGGVGAVAQHADLLLGEDRELVDDALGTDLLEDADDEVRSDDGEEQQVAVLPRERYDDGHGEVHAVEEREGVRGEDLGHRLGLNVRVAVHPAVRHAFGDLRRGESAQLMSFFGHCFPCLHKGRP